MIFQIGDRVAFKSDHTLTYSVENLDLRNNKILLRIHVPRDYCLAFGWDDASQYIKIPNLSTAIL